MTPPLDWFRGLQLDGSVTSDEVSAFAVVQMQRKPRAAAANAANAVGAEASPAPRFPAFPR